VTLFQQFKRNRDTRPNDPAFLIAAGDRSVPISWREFARDVEVLARVAARFAPRGVVGLLGENSYEWITAHAAGVFSGITVVPLEMSLTPAEIAERMLFTGATALVHSALYVEKANEVKRLLPDLVVAGFGSKKADEFIAQARIDLEAGAKGIFDGPEPDENAIATLVFTSGTTSKPRGAELTLAGIRTFSEFATAQLPMSPGDHSLMLLPLHHIFGICTTYMMLARGVALGVCPDFRRIYDAVERFRANYLFAVPALAEILAGKIAQRGKSAEEALGTPIEWVLVGGAPLARRTYEHLQELGIRPLTGYGLTETTALYSIAPVDDPRPGSAGKCCNGFAGMETRVSSRGTLQLRGPAVLKGYYREPARTADVLDADGWFDTGDVGTIDADGYVWITGRASRTIVLSSGKKVAPEELEEKLLSIPGIHEVVVSGDGASRDLKAEIYAVVSEDTVRKQIEALNRQLPVHKRIRIVEVRKEPFPRTSSGKIKIEAPSLPPPAKPSEYAPPPPKPEPPKTEPPHDAAAFWKAYVLPLTVTAIVVVAVNVVQHLLRYMDVPLPKMLTTLGEIGEIVLGILVLLVVLGIQHRNRVKDALTRKIKRRG